MVAGIILSLLMDICTFNGLSQWKKKAKHFFRKKNLSSFYKYKPENGSNVLNLTTSLNTLVLVFLNGFKSKVFIINL